MPGTSTSEMADSLRAKAHEHPTVATVKTQLPPLPDEGSPDEGLYIEAGHSPGLVVNGELRVSVLRVVSVGPDGQTLVGQIQAVREVDHPLSTWQLVLYTHDPEFFQTDRADDEQSWFIDLLEMHYDKTDAVPELETGIEA